MKQQTVFQGTASPNNNAVQRGLAALQKFRERAKRAGARLQKHADRQAAFHVTEKGRAALKKMYATIRTTMNDAGYSRSDISLVLKTIKEM